MLKIGDTGPLVEALQEQIGADKDGRFGPMTEKAVYAFQKSVGLTQDGIVGPQTQAALDAVKNGKHIIEPAITRIYGIDIYRHDNVISFDKAFQSGRKFCSIQIAQGLDRSLIHPAYKKISGAAKTAGMIVGPYFFPRFDQDIKAQATLFCDLVEQLADFQDTDLMPMLDLEFYPERDVERGDLEKSLIFCDIVKTRLKRKSIIYSGYFTIMGGLEYDPSIKDDLSQYTFWEAWYAPEKVVKTPSPWKHWDIWQYAEAPTPGMGNNCDLDVYNGSLDDLKALIRGSIL